MIWFFALPLSFLSLGILTNLLRKRRQLHYELTPNCLLTRWPVLFITGQRSFFYFSQYWNIYPEFLTEHGYEVYVLNLPWTKGAERSKRFVDFLNEHSRLGRHYHLVLDTPTHSEFAEIWEKEFACISSLNVLCEEDCSRSEIGFWQSFSYKLHHLKTWPKVTADPHCLGLSPEASLKNAQFLLYKISQRAEEDFQSP